MGVAAEQAMDEEAQVGGRGRAAWIGIVVLSLLGILIAGYLLYIKVANAKPYCAGLGDCELVNNGPYSQVAGIPVALLGLLAYIAILGAAVVALRGMPWAARSAATLITFGLALTGTLFSAYLTYLELFVIRVICPWCVASAIVMTLIFLLSIGQVREVI
jgi:uncharacterized membrane protein